jgi:uncharacterized protein YqgC (DUF456 family)
LSLSAPSCDCVDFFDCDSGRRGLEPDQPGADPVTIVLWIVAIALIVIGVVGTVVPAVPGVILVFAGIAFAAWIDDFARIPVWLLVVLGVLTVIAWTIDYAAAALGAKRVGASPRAIVGAALGTLAGIFTGLWGLLFMPLIGAAIGEYSAQRDVRRAGKVGIATWIGLLLGTAAKIAIVFAMIGIFVAALLV